MNVVSFSGFKYFGSDEKAALEGYNKAVIDASPESTRMGRRSTEKTIAVTIARSTPDDSVKDCFLFTESDAESLIEKKRIYTEFLMKNKINMSEPDPNRIRGLRPTIVKDWIESGFAKDILSTLRSKLGQNLNIDEGKPFKIFIGHSGLPEAVFIPYEQKF